MKLSLFELAAIWTLFLGQWVTAKEIKVLANDTRLVFGLDWRDIPDQCSGFAQTPSAGSVATFVFTGTAISVTLLRVFNAALVTVYLDGDLLAGDFDLVDQLVTNGQCHQQTINSTTLSNTSHNLTVQHAGRSPNSTSTNGDWLVLMHLVYTTVDETPCSCAAHPSTSAAENLTASSSPPSSFKQPAVIGGTVGGGLSGLFLGAAISWYFFRKRHLKDKGEGEGSAVDLLPNPNIPPPPTPFYTNPVVSYSHTPGGRPWAMFNPHEITPPDAPPADNQFASMVSTTNANRALSQMGSNTRCARPCPLPQKQRYPGMNYSTTTRTNPDQTAARVSSPPPPRYDYRGAGRM